jgi:ring-1,2-phenylacetyl-CoA epoxidase subunit PaaE
MLQFHSLELSERTTIAAEAVSLTFSVPDTLAEAFRFAAGQHVGIRVPLYGRELRRTYSIVSPPGGPLRIGVRVQGAVSRYLAERLPVGGRIDVMTPGGHFTPTLDPDQSRSYLAIAAGSGITPILSIAAAVLKTEPRSRFQLLYGNRDPERAMFLPELFALKDRYLTRFSVHCLMSRARQDVDLLNGRIDGTKLRELNGRLFDPEVVDEYFLSGSGAMVDELASTLRESGVNGRIHVERFSAGARTARVPASTPVAATAGDLVEVTVQMDGRQRTFSMPMEGPTLLEAAEAAGLELPFSCRDGICSTCRAKVTAGHAVMARNQALESWEVEAGFVLCCQARPTSRQLMLNYDEK